MLRNNNGLWEFLFMSPGLLERKNPFQSSWTSVASFTPKASKVQREELEIRRLSPNYMAVNKGAE